jgi:IS30 family transposase
MEERYHIQAYKKAGYKNYEIAKDIGVHPSTISRELSRNSSTEYHIYTAHVANTTALRRKSFYSSGSNKKMNEKVKELICKYIKKDWSPEQVSAMLKINHSISISYVTIYQFIREDKKGGGNLYTHLRHQGKRRVKYGCKYKGQIKDRISISARDVIVDKKTRIGDFEADTIVGANQKGSIVTIVDRKSMFVKISTPITKKPNKTAKFMIKLLSPFKDKIHTITTDNGFEFSNHKKVSNSLDCDYYFCHPYSSCERGLNENMT